ncbi:hypothetical protein CLAFUW4_07350 [Fulvia fulva]|uniref:Uncharacterized protein n=1 Tax=Passalora fulva TaxID=5499 RepID=A0A9Q8UQY0_PASFU|nr:uncharacterized protein CLAFUR5_07479 [Fulvia fulva]KAK4621706.1 hypothetical protein CLAFUR4_07357 [Fulvia fulva]KAK4622428.1 hypothetical protein CLAFUR0_07354 [Fulvia fulva]UJO19136.1 hypothetical protein CLAFUR5_07479 [Fulvia fulva]WPV16525.1 hypothetical protein CLAFUW4_07350 [Fulvia fulva]WPV30953.1 hypothetical protein CLAFUW7_07351 [Fulvia fulva]
MPSPNNNPANIANTNMSTDTFKTDKDFADIELGPNPLMADTYYTNGRAAWDTGLPSPPEYTGPGIIQPRTATKGKLRTRLANYTTKAKRLLPLLAYITSAAFALPGLIFLGRDFHNNGVCGSTDMEQVPLPQFHWIVYTLLWMVLMMVECINRLYTSKKGEHVKEAVRVMMGPLFLGVCILAAAAIACAAKGRCGEGEQA